jgi:acyl carrier protein
VVCKAVNSKTRSRAGPAIPARNRGFTNYTTQLRYSVALGATPWGPIQWEFNFTPVASMLLSDQIKNYLVETVGIDPQKFENPDLKVADLELDSLGLIEMLFEVEDKYGFQIPDPVAYLPMSFAEMVAAIEVLVQDHAKSQAAKS